MSTLSNMFRNLDQGSMIGVQFHKRSRSTRTNWNRGGCNETYTPPQQGDSHDYDCKIKDGVRTYKCYCGEKITPTVSIGNWDFCLCDKCKKLSISHKDCDEWQYLGYATEEQRKGFIKQLPEIKKQLKQNG